MAGRRLAILAAVAPLILVTACGGSGGKNNAGSPEPDGKEVVYIQGMSGIPFYSTVACGAQDEAKKHGITFSAQGASAWDVAKQTEIVNAVVARKPDAIMISVTDTKAMIPPLAQAKAAGIPIIGIDDDLADRSIMASKIQSDSIEGGKLAGERLGELIGGQGEVIAINNTPGTPIGDARVEGFKQGIAKFPGIKFLGVKYSNNETAKAANIASTTASSNANLKGIFAVTTNNTEGSVTGLREADKTGAVKLVGYDTSDPIVEALRKGSVDGLVVQYPYGEGVQGIKTAVDIWAGKQVERDQKSPFVVATPDNIDDPKVQEYIYKMECS